MIDGFQTDVHHSSFSDTNTDVFPPWHCVIMPERICKNTCFSKDLINDDDQLINENDHPVELMVVVVGGG